mgnify:FL=1
MRFTHPVNTLKKLGCGLAFGAAAIMAMPTSALACTQVYMGSKLTADGNTYYGRSEDFGPRYVKHFGIEPAHKDGNEYTSVESGFEYKSKGATYRYTFVRDNPSQWEDRYDAYSEAGINEKGVSCSATLSTSYNEKAEEADPITEETGIGEYSYASVILGESATAREGVELIGSLIDEQGVCSNDQIIIADSTETWLFAALSGHQWIAMRLADNIASLNPNIGNLTYDVDLDDTENCLHSEGIESMPKEKGFAEYTDGKLDVAKTYGEEIGEAGMHQWSRYIQGRDYFMAPLAEGTDYEIVKDEREDARATTGALVHEMQPLFFQPGKSDWNTFEMIRSFAARGENVAGLNANTDGAYAIGSNRNTEIHTFQIRHGMDPEIATIQWEMLSNAEFSVAIPLYSALLTEVSPYFSDQDVSFDHCEEEDVVNNEEPKNSINYVLMDINTLAYENRDHCATGVRAYLDALQKELIEQNLTVDEAMQAAEGTEARTALANKAGKAATKNTYLKCKAMLEEMRDYLKEEDFSEEFVPSDYDADNDCLVESITYADEALSDEDVAEPEVEEEEATEKKSEGNNMAAMAVGAIVIIGACGFVLYRRKKA